MARVLIFFSLILSGKAQRDLVYSLQIFKRDVWTLEHIWICSKVGDWFPVPSRTGNFLYYFRICHTISECKMATWKKNVKNAVSSCINWQRDEVFRIPNGLLLYGMGLKEDLRFQCFSWSSKKLRTNATVENNIMSTKFWRIDTKQRFLATYCAPRLLTTWMPQLISITQFSSTNIVVWRHPQFPAYARHTQNTPSIPRAGINIKQWLIVENKTAPTTTLTLTVKVKPHRAL